MDVLDALGVALCVAACAALAWRVHLPRITPSVHARERVLDAVLVLSLGGVCARVWGLARGAPVACGVLVAHHAHIVLGYSLRAHAPALGLTLLTNGAAALAVLPRYSPRVPPLAHAGLLALGAAPALWWTLRGYRAHYSSFFVSHARPLGAHVTSPLATVLTCLGGVLGGALPRAAPQVGRAAALAGAACLLWLLLWRHAARELVRRACASAHACHAYVPAGAGAAAGATAWAAAPAREPAPYARAGP